MSIVGRTEERRILSDIYESDEAEFVTVIGRRRVGKTFLVREVFKGRISFEITGIQNANNAEQLSNFHFALHQYFPNSKDGIPKNWIEAFTILIDCLKDSKKKCVLFFDELPWMATARSGFIKGLSFFWNSWASKNNVLLITCGSAASWMTQKIVLNKGGLHNRVTRQLILLPFTLKETKEYLESRNIVLSHYEIAQLYMTIGGIPFYLKLVPKGQSIPQITDTLLLSKNAALKYEFDNLYQSLFLHPEKYIRIMEACYSKWKGISHSDIAKITGIPSGGSITRMVKVLSISGFLEISTPLNRSKKDTLIRVIDEFSVFYLKFIKNKKISNWQSISRSPVFTSWQGFSFESLCRKHIHCIKSTLGISGVNTREFSFTSKGNARSKGTQIDLIIDRDDLIVNLCEMKFYNSDLTITKSIHQNLQEKIASLRSYLGTRKSIHVTLISTFGVKKNKYSNMVQSEIVLDDLFK